MIEALMARILKWETEMVADQLDDLEADALVVEQTQAERLAEFDREAAIHREHFIARMEIEQIELRCKLTAKRHRLSVLHKARDVA